MLDCNDEGKPIGLELNRGLRNEEENLYDIMAGPVLLMGLGEEGFVSLLLDMTQKCMEYIMISYRAEHLPQAGQAYWCLSSAKGNRIDAGLLLQTN